MVRSDMIHNAMLRDSGVSEMKSQKLSCAVCAWGKPRSCSCLAAWQIGEFDRILNEEYRDVVADDVPVALLGIELDSEAAHVSGQIRRALVAGDGGEANEGFGLLARPLEQVGLGDVGKRLIRLEKPMGAEAPRVDHTLGDAFMVEMEDLLAEVMVLEQGGAAPSHFEGVLVV
jgi:hypothetical protein